MNTTKLEAKRQELEKFRPSFQLLKKTTRLEVKRQSSSLQLLYRRHQKLKLRDMNWTISYFSSFSIEDNKN